MEIILKGLVDLPHDIICRCPGNMGGSYDDERGSLPEPNPTMEWIRGYMEKNGITSASKPELIEWYKNEKKRE
jgi:hypothetical protein